MLRCQLPPYSIQIEITENWIDLCIPTIYIYLYICFSSTLEKYSSYQLSWLLPAVLINFLKCFEECTEIPSQAVCQLEGYYKILHLLTRGFPQYLSSWQPDLLDRSFQKSNTVPVAGRFAHTIGVGVSQEELLTISSSLDISVVLLPLHLCASQKSVYYKNNNNI